MIGQFSWIQETLSNVPESIENGEVPDLDLDNAPWWYLKHRSEVFDKEKMNQALAKLYQKRVTVNFGEPWAVTMLILMIRSSTSLSKKPSG